MDPCSKEKDIDRLVLITDGTVKQLAKISVTLAKLEVLLEERIEKYDDHVDKGDAFRGQIHAQVMSVFVALIVATMAAVYGYGQVTQKTDIAYEHAMHEVD